MTFAPLKLIPLIDLTSLNAADTPEVIDVLCQKAQTPSGHVAAVCVYPQFVHQVRQKVADDIAVATVVNFPSGDEALEKNIHAIHQALQEGANEIDAVLPYNILRQGRDEQVLGFVRACREACGTATLKIIIESGALVDEALIVRASEICIEGDANFIKTSTGKIASGATLAAAKAILQVIQNNSEKATGIKISGGVRSIEDALSYVALAQEIMGESWITPENFRIGASKLLDEVLQIRNGFSLHD